MPLGAIRQLTIGAAEPERQDRLLPAVGLGRPRGACLCAMNTSEGSRLRRGVFRGRGRGQSPDASLPDRVDEGEHPRRDRERDDVEPHVAGGDTARRVAQRDRRVRESRPPSARCRSRSRRARARRRRGRRPRRSRAPGLEAGRPRAAPRRARLRGPSRGNTVMPAIPQTSTSTSATRTSVPCNCLLLAAPASEAPAR